MSHERDNKATEFISYVDRLRWDNYRRDFRNAERDLINLFWTLVLDYYVYLREMEVDRRRTIMKKKVFNSFIGCFFRPQEIIAKVMTNWQGFSRLDVDSNEKDWSDYQKKQYDLSYDHATELFKIIEGIPKSPKFYTSLDYPIKYDLSRWDDTHQYLNQPVSKCLKSFILKSRISKSSPNTILIGFQLKERDINELHRIGEQFIRAIFNRGILIYVKNSLLKNKKDRLAFHEFDNISLAIDYLKGENPTLTYHNRENVVYLMDLFCRNREGNKFKENSINKFIRRKMSS